jgi:hypothetical protein
LDFYHYTNIPGSYAWFPEKNELRHISYIGTTVEAGWVIFTDDFRYLIQDFGTSPGPRGLGVWQVEDGRRIFSGTYYNSINLQNHTINIVYVYDNWNISNNVLDKEIMDFAEEFIVINPVPEEMVENSRRTGLGIELIIICELDLNTGIRSIVNGEYIFTQ